MSDPPIGHGVLSRSPAAADDLPFVLHLCDEAVVWLNQRGMDRQWGTAPSSAAPRIRHQYMGWIHQGTMVVAVLAGRIVGSLALNPMTPAYVAHRWDSFPAPALYLEAVVTSRALAGQGVGRALLTWAERDAWAPGKTTIWLDCWAENAALVRYIQQMGFVTRGKFLLKEWRGQLFEKQLAHR